MPISIILFVYTLATEIRSFLERACSVKLGVRRLGAEVININIRASAPAKRKCFLKFQVPKTQ